MNETDLQRENRRLKIKANRLIERVKQLEEKISQLEKYIVDNDYTHSKTIEHLDKLKSQSQQTDPALQNRKINLTTVALTSIRYIEAPKPTLYVNDHQIRFEKASNLTAQTAKAICQFDHLQKMKNERIPLDELYDWFGYSEPWENITPRERRDFKKNVEQWVYRLNQKIAKQLNGKCLFEMSSDGCKFNGLIRITFNRQ